MVVGRDGGYAGAAEECAVCRWQAGFVFLLLGASIAAGQGQRQRTYVFPQTARVTPGEPGLVNAMCLDPKVNGAPETGDPITCWERPDVIVIRRLRGGQVVGTQRGSDLAQGATPWVRFEGASDVTGHVALQALAVQPEAGVGYEVQFVEGTAAARPQEGLTGFHLTRLKEFDGSFGVIGQELRELHAAFPADGLLTRLYEAFAQQALYPAMSRDVPAQELERGTRRFVARLESACQAADGEVQTLLAVLFAGTPEPTNAQRAFLARHGISWGDVEFAADELAAVAQFRRAYTETMLQACAGLCCGEPNATADGLALARRGLDRLVRWHRAGLRCDGPNIAYALGPAFKVTFRNGEPWLGREIGPAAFNLPQLVRRLRGVREALTSEKRRGNLEKELVRLHERLARLNVSPRVSGNFWDQELPQQTCALVLLGEQIRGIPLPPGLQKLLHKGPPLPLALRVALQEERWLIDVRGLEGRERQRLEPHVAEFEELSGVACTLLTSESTRQRLAGLADEGAYSSE